VRANSSTTGDWQDENFSRLLCIMLVAAGVASLRNPARSRRGNRPRALTGHDLKAHLKPAAVSAGGASYLMKPCLPEQLEREVAVRISAKLEADARSRRVASAE